MVKSYLDERSPFSILSGALSYIHPDNFHRHSYVFIRFQEEFGYRDVLNIADKFAVGVANSPETLDCLHQNRPLNQINKETDLRKFPEAPKNDKGKKDSSLPYF